MLRIGRLDRRHVVLHQLVRGAAIALEREFHVLGGDRLAIVEFDALAQHEFVAEPVLRGRPRLGEARRLRLARHRLHHRVVQRVEHHEGGDDPLRLGRVEPGRRQRDVDGPGQLAAGCGRPGHAGRAGDKAESGQRQNVPTRQTGFVRAAASCAAAAESEPIEPPPHLGHFSEPCAERRPPLRKCLDVSRARSPQPPALLCALDRDVLVGRRCRRSPGSGRTRTRRPAARRR